MMVFSGKCDRSFAATGPRVWNSLPASMRASDDYKHFKRLFKIEAVALPPT